MPTGKNVPKTSPNTEATRLEAHLKALLGHEHVRVRPHGAHLLIQVNFDGDPDTVARLTRIEANTHTSAFRNHAGRWEPLPLTGPLETVAAQTVETLRPYMMPT